MSASARISAVVYMPLPEAMGLSGAVKKIAADCQVSLRMAYKWLTGSRPVAERHKRNIMRIIREEVGNEQTMLLRFADALLAVARARMEGRASAADAASIKRMIDSAILSLSMMARNVEEEARK